MEEKVIQLGKALVEELELEESYDTLSKWIANYIAELMSDIDMKAGIEKSQAEEKCFNAILKLWKHRFSLPNWKYPYKRFESIFHELERLDPEYENTYYYENPYKKILESDELHNETKHWLNVCNDIDQIARIWIEYALIQAAKSSYDEKTLKWITNSISSREVDEVIVIGKIVEDQISEDELVVSEKEKQQKIDQLNLRIKKLESFSIFNDLLLKSYQTDLEDIK